MDEPKIAQGFDRGLDFEEIKTRLIKHLSILWKKFGNINLTKYKRRIFINKMCYVMIAMIQLRNGARVSEACEAFCKFIDSDDLNEKVIVKIAKSEKKQYLLNNKINTKKTKKQIKTKPRYRKIVFSDWIDKDIFYAIKDRKPVVTLIQNKRLKNRVSDYMQIYFDTNTHSLRYACINYLLNEKQISMPVVASYVGHINCNQLVTYTQQKNVDKVLDMDI
jgi:integrase